MRHCKHCNADKPLDQFYQRSNGRYQAWCKECYKEWNALDKTDPVKKEAAKIRHAVYYETHKDEHKQYYIEKYKDPVELEKQRKRQREWYERHKTESSEYLKERYIQNREQIVEQHHRYESEQWKNNPEFRKRKAKNKSESIARRKDDPEFIKKRKGWVRTANHKRRILLKGARNIDNMLTNEEWEAICERYGYSCLCCGKQIEVSFDMTCDHIVPITKDGLHTAKNVQLLCRSCNGKKHTKIIDYRPK